MYWREGEKKVIVAEAEEKTPRGGGKGDRPCHHQRSVRKKSDLEGKRKKRMDGVKEECCCRRRTSRGGKV